MGSSDQPDPLAATQITNSGAPDEAYCTQCNRSFAIETLTCPHDGTRLVKLAGEKDLLVGRILDGRYEIRAPLGEGGMGTVYRGLQISVDREVAIKVISPKLASDRNAVKRFLREARLASRLSQPNIVNVYDFGNADDVLYIVMELLRGHTLATELEGGRRLNVRRTVIIAQQLCDALEAAHSQDIVHRDLKPGNIVILDDPPGRDLVKVLDFGLAKSLAHDSGSKVTQPDGILGTPLYMAPEQIENRDSDQRADLYSLGCIMYEMLSGAPPFVDSRVSAVLARHIGDDPAELPELVPPKIRELVKKLLAKEPADRVQAAGDVRRVLEDVLEHPGLRGPAPDPHASTFHGKADTEPDVSGALAASAAQAVSEARARRATTGRRWIVLGLLVVALGGGAAYLAVTHASSKATPAADALGVPAAGDALGMTPAAMIDAAAAPPPVDATLAAPVDAAVDAPTKRPHGRQHRDGGASDDPPADFYPVKKPPKQ